MVLNSNHGFDGRFGSAIPGDIGQTVFYNYLHNNNLKCESRAIADNSPLYQGSPLCYQSLQGTPELILVGDSHAEHLFPGLAEYLQHKNVAYYARNGKPYLESAEFKDIFGELISNKERQHVILTMCFVCRLDAHATGLYEGFYTTIRALLDAGKLVTLIGDVPAFKRDSKFCVYFISERISNSCVLSIDEALRQRMIYDNVMERLANDFGLNYLRIDQVFCSEKLCSMAERGTILYRDSAHLNIIGSRIVGETIGAKSTF